MKCPASASVHARILKKRSTFYWQVWMPPCLPKNVLRKPKWSKRKPKPFMHSSPCNGWEMWFFVQFQQRLAQRHLLSKVLSLFPSFDLALNSRHEPFVGSNQRIRTNMSVCLFCSVSLVRRQGSGFHIKHLFLQSAKLPVINLSVSNVFKPWSSLYSLTDHTTVRWKPRFPSFFRICPSHDRLHHSFVHSCRHLWNPSFNCICCRSHLSASNIQWLLDGSIWSCCTLIPSKLIRGLDTPGRPYMSKSKGKGEAAGLEWVNHRNLWFKFLKKKKSKKKAVLVCVL